MNIEMKHQGDIEADGRTIKSILLYHRHGLLMNVDLYSDRLSFYWPSSHYRVIDLFG